MLLSSEMVVPLHQYPKNESCTAILNLDTLKWSKLAQKGPLNINWLSFFYLISDAEKKHIFLLGGGETDPYFMGTQEFPNKYMVYEPNYQVQLLDGNEWRVLPRNISQKIDFPIATIPLDFFYNNNFPKIEFNDLTPNRELNVDTFIVQ